MYTEARIKCSEELLSESQRESIFYNTLADPQSFKQPREAPIVVREDLTKGRGEIIAFGEHEQEIKIDQSSWPINLGRASNFCRNNAIKKLGNYFGKLNDQTCLVHLAGARGSNNKFDWIVPMESDSDFNEVMVNPVLPPTSSRYMVAGGKRDVSEITPKSALTLNEMSRLKDSICGSLKPFKIMKGNGEEYEECWCLLVSPSQWYYLQIAAGDEWSDYVEAARKVSEDTHHPLFAGNAAYWEEMIIRSINYPIRFNEGDTVKVQPEDGGEEQTDTVPDGITVDRAILVGRLALGWAQGDVLNGTIGDNNMFPMSYHEAKLNFGLQIEVAGFQMDGKQKLQFKKYGKSMDLGTYVIDSYAPDLFSDEGMTLEAFLQSS